VGRKAAQGSTEVNTDEDRYPDFNSLLRRIVAETELGDGLVGRLEVNCQANGEATYRVWSPRAEEPDGGFIPAPGN
jgi:hypothetical protein